MGGDGTTAPHGGPVLEVEGLTKRYGATTALGDASFALARGEVLAALGQNGAGKSTLVKLLAGVVQPTAGTIRFDGAPLALHGARDALRRGIVLIPQELAYVRDLSVAENVLLGSWAARRGFVSRRALRAAAAPFAAEVGLDGLLDEPMSRLTLAQCQLAEIAKALSRDARVLLLDEPTAALSDAEGLALFAALRNLRERGVAMIYISHRLDEVLARTDRLLVLRDGRVVADRPTAGATRGEVIEHMLGHRRAPAPAAEREAAPPRGRSGERPLLSLRGVAHRGRGLRQLTLDVHRGEIVGLFGVAGSGHETAALMLAGLFPHDTGELYVEGTLRGPIRTPRHARRLGIRYVPPERKRQGLVLAHSVRANMTFPQLPRFARWGVMRPAAEEALVRTAAAQLSLRYGGSDQPVQELSGGNQQKVLLASRIYAEPTLLVIQEPSRGVDVAARDEIHELLVQIARGGRTIVFATSDVEEAVALSDRLLVLREGRLEATLERTTKSEANALAAAGRSELEE